VVKWKIVAVGTGLKYVGTGLTLLARRQDGEAVPMAETVPTVAVGTNLHVPTTGLAGTSPVPTALIFCRRHRIVVITSCTMAQAPFRRARARMIVES
jgi:hypothetical protein